MKDIAAAIVIALLVWLSAWFVTFEPDMTRWTEAGRYGFLFFTGLGFAAYKAFNQKTWSRK